MTMEPIELFNNLPECIQILVTGYDPLLIFHLPIAELKKYNWYKLARINLGLNYSPETCPETEIMGLYYENCIIERSKMGYSGDNMIIIHKGKLMAKGPNIYGILGLGDNLKRDSLNDITYIPNEVEEVLCGGDFTIVRLVDRTLMLSGSKDIKKDGKVKIINSNLFEEIPELGKM